MKGHAPPRPDASVSMRRATPSHRWLPTVAVLGVVTMTTLGGFVVSAVLSEPVGPPVSISGVVTVQPLSGWEPAEGGLVAERPIVRITRGSGTLAAVAWGPVVGGAETLAAEVVDELLRDDLDRLTVSELLTPVTLDQGLEGQRFTFVGIDRASGSAVEGEVTTVVAPGGEGVVFVGVAPGGSLAFVDGDLHTMIAAASLGAQA